MAASLGSYTSWSRPTLRLVPTHWCWDICPRCLSGVNKAVKHHVCYVEHSQPTKYVGTPTIKDWNRSKETISRIGKVDLNSFCLYDGPRANQMRNKKLHSIHVKGVQSTRAHTKILTLWLVVWLLRCVQWELLFNRLYLFNQLYQLWRIFFDAIKTDYQKILLTSSLWPQVF